MEVKTDEIKRYTPGLGLPIVTLLIILFMIFLCGVASAEIDANVTAQIEATQTLSYSFIILFAWFIFLFLAEWRKDLIYSVVMIGLTIFAYFHEQLAGIEYGLISLPILMFFISVYMIGMSIVAIFKNKEE